MSSAKHFYLTFNPHLNSGYEKEYTQAHEFFDLLQGLVKKNKNSSAYWGKIIGADRKSNLDLQKFESVIAENNANELSTHLYITDFKNIWATKVVSVKNSITKKNNCLPFYEGKNVEIWFEISDMILLEYNHDETASKLSELYIDNDFNDIVINGLSPFTTKISYPAIIQDIACEQYFDEFDTSEISHLILRPHSAIYSNALDNVLRCLHTYVFSEQMYAKIPHAAKLEIEAAELDMLEHRHHNLRGIAFNYLKALEIIMNDLVIHHLKRLGMGEDFFVDPETSPPRLYTQQEKDYYIPIKRHQKNFSINQIIYFVERCVNSNHISFKKAFSDHKQFINFVKKDLGNFLKENQFVNIRGILAHNNSSLVTIEDATAIRNIVLGVGCKGLICKLYQSFYPDLFSNQIKVTSDYNKDGDKDYSAKSKAQNKLKLVS